MNQSEEYRAGDLRVDLANRQVSRDGEQISLSDLSWRVLSILITRAPATVGYEELAAQAWPQQQVSPDTMSQRIKLLRRSLEDDPKTPRYVATERGIGYRFIAEVAPITASRTNIPKRLLLGGSAALTASLVFFLWMSQQPVAPVPPSPDITAAVSTSDLIERGNQYLVRGSFDDNEHALSLFEQAAEKDPDNVAAMIGQSFAHSHRETKYDFDHASSHKAKALAQRSLDLAPGNGRAWHALGFALDAQGDIQGALRAYEQAIAIDPDDFGAISSAAYLLQIQGRLHEALLFESDVLSQGQTTLFTLIQIASTLRLAGLQDAADTWLARAETLTPDNILLADTKTTFLLAQEKYDEAAAASDATANQHRASLMVLNGETQLALGNVDAARAAFQNALSQDKNNFAGAYESAALAIDASMQRQQIDAHQLISDARTDRENGDQWPSLSIGSAYLYAAIGDGEAAASALRDAHRWGYRDVQRLRASPFFRPVREDPAFQSVLADIQKDVDIQRALIENDQRLAHLLNLDP